MLSIPKTHYTECSVYRILIRPKSRYAEDSLHRNYFFQNGFGIVTIRCNGIRCSEYLKQNLIYTDILIHWYTLIYNDINWDKLRSQIRIIWWVWTISELLLWTRKWTASNFLVIFRDGSSPYFLPCLKFSSNDFFSDFFSDLFETTTTPPPIGVRVWVNGPFLLRESEKMRDCVMREISFLRAGLREKPFIVIVVAWKRKKVCMIAQNWKKMISLHDLHARE